VDRSSLSFQGLPRPCVSLTKTDFSFSRSRSFLRCYLASLRREKFFFPPHHGWISFLSPPNQLWVLTLLPPCIPKPSFCACVPFDTPLNATSPGKRINGLPPVSSVGRPSRGVLRESYNFHVPRKKPVTQPPPRLNTQGKAKPCDAHPTSIDTFSFEKCRTSSRPESL